MPKPRIKTIQRASRPPKGTVHSLIRNFAARQSLSPAQRTDEELPARLALEWLRTNAGQRYDFYLVTRAMVLTGYFAALGFQSEELDAIRKAQMTCHRCHASSEAADRYFVDEDGFRILAKGLDVFAAQLVAATGADLQTVVQTFDNDGEARWEVKRAA